MGIEFLENAARAAGFAMAADEPAADAGIPAVSGEPWRPGTVPLHQDSFDGKLDKAQATFTDWVKGVVGGSGRGAPA